MIRSYFSAVDVAGSTTWVPTLPPSPNRVALRFCAPQEGAYLVQSAIGGQLLVRAGGQDTELTRTLYGDLLDTAWSVMPITYGGATPTSVCILISQNV